MKFDLHVHTQFSPCSSMSINEIIEQAVRRGLHGICFTDHNTMEIANHIGEGIQGNGICVIFGIEYDTPQGDYLVFMPGDCEICEIDVRFDAEKLFDYVYTRGGAAVAAHPFRKNRPAAEQVMKNEERLIIEAINGRNTDEENNLARDWSARYGLRSCGGSDAHLLEEIGTVYTEFKSEIKTRDEFITALRFGDYHPVVDHEYSHVLSCNKKW